MRTFAIIPAAGRSVRMACAKLLLPWRGRTIIEHVLEHWRSGGVDERVVVVHPDDREVSSICLAAGATVCVPHVAPPEMKDSVQAALELITQRWAPNSEDVWLLAPADMPQLSDRLIRSLIDKRRGVDSIIAPRLTDGTLGHPVLFPWRFAAFVAETKTGVRELLQSHPVDLVDWDDVHSFDDVDSSDEYRRLCDRPLLEP